MLAVPKKAGNADRAPLAHDADSQRGCAMFEFHGAMRGEPPHPGIYPSVSEAQQREFEAAFYTQIGLVKKWFADSGWIPENTELLPLQKSGTYQPDKKFHVFISEEYEFSRALVPAWSAQRGRMEFPADRVVAGEAALAHELVHVFFPNGNRMLAEGLAVYLHQVVAANPAFPNFQVDLHELVAKLITDHDGPFNGPSDLKQISIAKLDKIPTPDDMTFRIGQQSCDDASVTYALAGSFTRFLIEHCEPKAERQARKCPTFLKLYRETPLVPMVRNPGNADRWERIYGRSLEELEAKWKKMIHRLLASKS
jgi:hypothetical protein